MVDAGSDEAPREWLSIVDPDEERTWLFDVTFLMSRWTCIYGQGCPGVEEAADPDAMIGCCSHGAWIGDDDDEALVRRRIDELTEADWERRGDIASAAEALFVDDEGNTRTRVVDGACIMMNRPGFGRFGAGCSLHQAALARDEPIHDWKPSVCWQAPLRREDLVDANGHVWSTVRDWKRRDWGEGGDDFGWWCVEEPAAFVGEVPVYIGSEADLRRLSTDVVYDELRRLLDGRRGEVWLPHPARRQVTTA